MATGAKRINTADWHGELELGFCARGGRTVVGHRRHRGPLMVQSPFYPEGSTCHLYLLHPPGGLVGGDRITVTLDCAAGTQTLITMPASGKVYRSAGATSQVWQHLQLAAGATLEWLPAETILFDGARCRSRTRLELVTGSRLLAWEAWGLGRPACGERFTRGEFIPSLEVFRDGHPLLVERSRLRGGSQFLQQPFGLAGNTAAGTLLAHPADAQDLAEVRSAIGTPETCLVAASLVDGLLACRVLAASLAPLRRQLEAWWQGLRPRITGLAPVAPRIWAT